MTVADIQAAKEFMKHAKRCKHEPDSDVPFVACPYYKGGCGEIFNCPECFKEHNCEGNKNGRAIV